MIYSKYTSRAICLLASIPVILTAQKAQENVVPLNNWPSAVYWHPNEAESLARGGLLPRGPAPASTEPVFLTFVAITPCRLVDTRGTSTGFDGGITPFNGPALAATTTTTFAVQSSAEATGGTANTGPAACGVIPSIAEAYSFNVTVMPQAGGVAHYVTLWATGSLKPVVSTVNDPQGLVVANAAIVAAGVSGSVNLYTSGPATVDVVIDMNGYFAASTDLNGNTAVGTATLFNNTDGYGNVAVGTDALTSNTTGGYNVANGIYALEANTSGTSNTASGQAALQNNTQGSYNTAYGSGALEYNHTGANNTGIGFQALQNNTASYNTATGNGALVANTVGGFNTAGGVNALANSTTGSDNTAFGEGALGANVSGANNIGIGVNAGSTAPNGNSNSIYIDSPGTASDTAGTIQIGTQGTQTGGTSIAGISGASVTGAAVYVNASGQLGIAPSASRFKDQITDMGDTSSKLLQLRPVNFFYKPGFDDGSHLLQYGLIAEEVAKVYPEMVAYGKDGQVLTVKYQLLAPMLLNELQKQAEQNRKLEDRLAALETLLAGSPEPIR